MGLVKGILNRDVDRSGETRWLLCCWDDCERQGVTLHRTRFHDHPPNISCDGPDVRHVWYVFCSESHRQLFLHGHRQYGQLPSGSRGRFHS